jgi:hypothetical protein
MRKKDWKREEKRKMGEGVAVVAAAAVLIVPEG